MHKQWLAQQIIVAQTQDTNQPVTDIDAAMPGFTEYWEA